jgi:hypothetical protein
MMPYYLRSRAEGSPGCSWLPSAIGLADAHTTATSGGEAAMTLHPKVPTDMALAPVAAEIDSNLQRLRDKSAGDIQYELGLELDRPLFANTRDERAGQVLQMALRNVDRHGWEGAITDDDSRLHLTGGSVTLDLGLGAAVMGYIEGGT